MLADTTIKKSVYYIILKGIYILCFGINYYYLYADLKS